jgi:hypothetical protein
VYQRGKNGLRRVGSISDRRTSPPAGRPKLASLSLSHILKRKSDSGMKLSMFPCTAAENRAEDSKEAEQSGVGNSTETESKEIIVSTPDYESSAV